MGIHTLAALQFVYFGEIGPHQMKWRADLGHGDRRPRPAWLHHINRVSANEAVDTACLRGHFHQVSDYLIGNIPSTGLWLLCLPSLELWRIALWGGELLNFRVNLKLRPFGKQAFHNAFKLLY